MFAYLIEPRFTSFRLKRWRADGRGTTRSVETPFAPGAADRPRLFSKDQVEREHTKVVHVVYGLVDEGLVFLVKAADDPIRKQKRRPHAIRARRRDRIAKAEVSEVAEGVVRAASPLHWNPILERRGFLFMVRNQRKLAQASLYGRLRR